MIAAKGLLRFSLREVSRKADVSPTAIYHYFPRVEDFIAELAILAAARFRDRIVEAQPAMKKNLLLSRLEAYVAHFSEFPNDLELVFGQHDGWSEELARLRLETFTLLEAAVSEAAANLPSRAVKEASFDIWTAIHGYVLLERAGLVSPRMSGLVSAGDARAAWIERIAEKAIRPARRRA